ncbi:MAG: cysteine--tRNA ligase [Dehalococcoidales bacterium]|jgi:cysteinyl-tRNA synthetase|nr:cysteine--tRNA ligase [Dehalococcoidales bacterium]
MKIFNTLSGEKEDFLPQSDPVKMYVCGVTPYAEAHIGHAMSYIIFDVIRRYLEFRGYTLRYVQNITDIDNKIIDRANELGISTVELAKKYTDSFFADMDALNVGRADIYPRATEEIPKIIEVVAGLVDSGFAYPANGSVYFRVREVADYGKLARRDLEFAMSMESTVGNDDKENPMDFVLWKASKPGEPSWKSPWGPGRPGWHIECSAMSLKYLGDTIDIHGGGRDLIFPHHENEIAQSESFSGKKPFVKYWLHNGLLQLGEEKMSKSLGNLITIKEALGGHSADAIRIFVLSSNYRSPLTYSEEALEAAESGAERLRRVISRDDSTGGAKETFDAEPYRKQFIEAMDDDFNTAQAMAILFDLAREINQRRDENHDVVEIQQIFHTLASVFGLTLKLQEQTFEEKLYNKSRSFEQYAVQNLKGALKFIKTGLPKLAKNESMFTGLSKSLRCQFPEGTYSSLDKAVEYTGRYTLKLDSLRNRLKYATNPRDFNRVLADVKDLSTTAAMNVDSYSDFRNQLREAKQWQLADEIRAELDELGIALEDTSKGTVWKHKW